MQPSCSQVQWLHHDIHDVGPQGPLHAPSSWRAAFVRVSFGRIGHYRPRRGSVARAPRQPAAQVCQSCLIVLGFTPSPRTPSPCPSPCQRSKSV
jgi:hypothetical protein